jgi:hypothetical protein
LAVSIQEMHDIRTANRLSRSVILNSIGCGFLYAEWLSGSQALEVLQRIRNDSRPHAFARFVSGLLSTNAAIKLSTNPGHDLSARIIISPRQKSEGPRETAPP